MLLVRLRIVCPNNNNDQPEYYQSLVNDSINVCTLEDVCACELACPKFRLFNYNVNAMINNINNHYHSTHAELPPPFFVYVTLEGIRLPWD